MYKDYLPTRSLNQVKDWTDVYKRAYENRALGGWIKQNKPDIK